MLGRLYAFVFICAIGCALWYQKRYLEISAKELNTQISFENSILPTSTAVNFQNTAYEDAYIKYSFSGNKITYFSDNHFEAEGNLIYEAFEGNKKRSIMIKTDKAYGQIDANKLQDKSNSALPIGANSRIQNATLPGDVWFDFNGNIGKAKHVIIDMAEGVIYSAKSFDSNGPQGNLKGNGFRYSLKEEEFKILSNVKGDLKINESKSN